MGTDLTDVAAGHGLEARATAAKMAATRWYFARIDTYFAEMTKGVGVLLLRGLWREGAEAGVLGLVMVGHSCVIEEPAFVGVGADIGGLPAAIGLDGLYTRNLKMFAVFCEESVCVVDTPADWF